MFLPRLRPPGVDVGEDIVAWISEDQINSSKLFVCQNILTSAGKPKLPFFSQVGFLAQHLADGFQPPSLFCAATTFYKADCGR